MTAALARLLEEAHLDALDEDHLALAENLKIAFRILSGAAAAESGLTVEDEVLIVLGGELQLRQLLAENELSVTDISRRLGFSSVHYFSRRFRIKTGSAPMQYAASLQSKLNSIMSGEDLGG